MLEAKLAVITPYPQELVEALADHGHEVVREARNRAEVIDMVFAMKHGALALQAAIVDLSSAQLARTTTRLITTYSETFPVFNYLPDHGVPTVHLEGIDPTNIGLAGLVQAINGSK